MKKTKKDYRIKYPIGLTTILIYFLNLIAFFYLSIRVCILNGSGILLYSLILVTLSFILFILSFNNLIFNQVKGYSVHNKFNNNK